MSSPLAIAGVSAVLKNLLDNALADNSLTGSIAGLNNVTLTAPNRVNVDATEAPQLNLYLYRISANQGWRNVAFPSRNAGGDRLTNPPLAIDLHYLLTAYGKVDFDAEILLGNAMQVLHETPVLTRDVIRATLPITPRPAGVPEPMGSAMVADLADQVEQIKIVPEFMNAEEMSKLWTALQAPYHTSMGYFASVVLIESRRPVRSALPVLSRGPVDLATGRESGVTVQADLRPQFPTLEQLFPPNSQTAIRLGETLTCNGYDLAGDAVVACFVHARTGRQLLVPANAGGTARSFNVTLPAAPPLLDWDAGIYTVRALITRGLTMLQTNDLAIALAPRVVPPILVSPPDAALNVTLTVTCSPQVRSGQSVALIVGDREIAASPFATSQTDTLTFVAHEFANGDYWVRLRVDGVESILIDRSVDPPQFIADQVLHVGP